MNNALFGTPRYRISGDRGLLVEYGDRIAPEVNRKVRSLAALLAQEPLAGIKEVIPTYRSLLIVYDPGITDPQRLGPQLNDLERRLDEIEIPPPETVVVPVCYGGEFGPDIEAVAERHNLSAADVVRIHSATDYPIYMIGFTPGFPFLGGLPPELHTPRLKTPRTHVPAGSVGIANNQTGIYPVASPGGWQLIGRTPLRLFAPEKRAPFLYKSGDLIRFEPIDAAAFDRIAKEQIQHAGL